MCRIPMLYFSSLFSSYVFEGSLIVQYRLAYPAYVFTIGENDELFCTKDGRCRGRLSHDREHGKKCRCSVIINAIAIFTAPKQLRITQHILRVVNILCFISCGFLPRPAQRIYHAGVFDKVANQKFSLLVTCNIKMLCTCNIIHFSIDRFRAARAYKKATAFSFNIMLFTHSFNLALCFTFLFYCDTSPQFWVWSCLSESTSI